MGRQHVHFAPGISSSDPRTSSPTSTPDPSASISAEPPRIISGMRNDATVLVWVDVRGSLEAGLKWWRSANGVLLTEGDEEGKVGLGWVVRAERRGGKVIWGDGEKGIGEKGIGEKENEGEGGSSGGKREDKGV